MFAIKFRKMINKQFIKIAKITFIQNLFKRRD